MTWITHISYAESDGRLRKLYDRVKGPDNNVDNIMLAHSLRPHTMEGHMALYKTVLHHSGNSIPKWFLEALGVYVSMLNHCDYCLEHHFAGMARLIDDEKKANLILNSMRANDLTAAFGGKETAALEYAHALTRSLADTSAALVESLRRNGWSDGEILEINQVVAYFAYANRTVLGLGVEPIEPELGLAPSGQDWQHRA